MRRLHGAFTALALAATAGPAGAAEITHLATAGEPGNLFELDLGVRWDRTVEAATITRENADERLRYVRTRNAIVPRIAFGLWRDLELHAEVPYVLGDDQQWRYGERHGVASGPGTAPNTIAGNGIDASGAACTTLPCPIFPVDPSTTDYHGGRAGDLKVGLAWGIFNDRKDDTKAFWLVGMDLTAPTATRWDPGKGRTADTWSSPFRAQASPGPIGEKIWKWDLYTALSKRYRYFDPYVKAHAQLAFRSASTYSNCDAAQEATATTLQARQMNANAVAGCAAAGSSAGAKLPFVAGLLVGTEIIPYEDRRESQRLSIDVRIYGDVTSSQRFYNELTAATGKLLQTEGYLEVGGLAGLYLRASSWVMLTAQASIATRTSHYLTGEALGDPAAQNPNFDWRYDAPGRRFRLSEVSIFALSFGGVLQF